MSFLAIILGIAALIYGYTGWRLIPPVQLPLPWNLAAWFGLVLVATLPFVSFFLRQHLDGIWASLLSWLTYLSLGFFVLLCSLLLLRDLAWLLWAGLDHLQAYARTLAPPDPTRRNLVLQAANLGTVVVALGVAGYGFYHARRRPRVDRIEVRFPDLPPALEGLRLVQFSDVHAGPTIKRPQVEAMVAAIEELGADLILFTGDLVDGSVEDLRFEVEPLARLRAPLGCYFVTGNHEYYSGVEAWIAEASRLGFTVLLNEHRLLCEGQLLLAGVTDYGGGDHLPAHVSDPKAALGEAPPPGALRLLLAHQPRSIFAAAEAGYHLQLSGHTHGGQFVPWKYFIPLQQPYIEGLHRHGDTWVYVNRGAGYWGPPVRVGAPSEIALITLRRG
ncbi:MAG: metallophosphoesterase [Candidatus Latescibacteria bacterium]|nr:metallophosphoesterase [Candidatus Latescibacterota bacterium]